MLNITIIAIGKIKEPHYAAACAEYLKRLTPFARVKVLELEAEAFKRNEEKEKAKEKEAERILSALKKFPDANIFILDEHGREFTSIDFANQLEKDNRHTVLVIGGSLGLHESVLQKYKQHLALSKFTFPHELARVVLIEQVYRAAMIGIGKEYHY